MFKNQKSQGDLNFLKPIKSQNSKYVQFSINSDSVQNSEQIFFGVVTNLPDAIQGFIK